MSLALAKKHTHEPCKTDLEPHSYERTLPLKTVAVFGSHPRITEKCRPENQGCLSVVTFPKDLDGHLQGANIPPLPEGLWKLPEVRNRD